MANSCRERRIRPIYTCSREGKRILPPGWLAVSILDFPTSPIMMHCSCLERRLPLEIIGIKIRRSAKLLTTFSMGHPPGTLRPVPQVCAVRYHPLWLDQPDLTPLSWKYVYLSWPPGRIEVDRCLQSLFVTSVPDIMPAVVPRYQPLDMAVAFGVKRRKNCRPHRNILKHIPKGTHIIVDSLV